MPCKVTLFYRDRQEVTINKKADKKLSSPKSSPPHKGNQVRTKEKS